MANTYSSLFYHFVFSTKFRQRYIKADIESRVWEYIGGIVKSKGIEPIKIGGIDDHLHSLILSPPKFAPSEIVRMIKAGSSGWFKRTFTRAFGWQDGFAAFSVSAKDVPRVVNYIENQRAHHSNRTFEEEYLEILNFHEIDIIDERYLFG